jgi:hypothetical protein
MSSDQGQALNRQSAHEICDSFLNTVDNIYGVYLDATHGFGLVRQRVVDAQTNIASQHSVSMAHLDSITMTYGKGEDPDSPGAVELHTITQGEVKARNERGGTNWIFLANVCLVSIYQYWEDHFREALATALGKSKYELLVPLMGDLRLYRMSIIHHRGIALREVERCEVLQWFRPGERIELTPDHMETIVLEINRAVRQIAEQADPT